MTLSTLFKLNAASSAVAGPSARTRAANLFLCASFLLLPRVSGGQEAGLGGMTGLIIVPTAETLDDASFRLGSSFLDREWAYTNRGRYDNWNYYVSLGFLPRLELGFRASVQQGSRFLGNLDAPNVDRMGSARLCILKEKLWPALAVGIDDVRGTRSNHSLYAVGTKNLFAMDHSIAVAISVGHGTRSLRASHYVLDGTFGGLEIKARHFGSAIAEFDTEKWNTGVRVGGKGVSALVTLLDFETLSGGINWTHHF